MSDEEKPKPPRIGRNFINLAGLTGPEVTKLLTSGAVVSPLYKNGIVTAFKPDTSGIIRDFISPINFRIHNQLSDALNPLRDSLKVPFEELITPFKQGYLQSVLGSIQPFLKRDFFDGIERNMLPPNLRAGYQEIKPTEVYEFLKVEGIPLYIVPRLDIALRLLRSPTHQARRKVLNDRHDAIVSDCLKALQPCTSPIVSSEVAFVRDGIKAMQNGSHASAQALFTVTLDTFVTKLLTTKETKKSIVVREVGQSVPTTIEKMGLHQAFIWLPIWNSHGVFRVHAGDKIPSDYSRHATVHAVSKIQYSKRNTVQALMLITSLLAYAQQQIDRVNSRRS